MTALGQARGRLQALLDCEVSDPDGDQFGDDVRTILSALPPEKLLRQTWGALNFILAFYEPGQTYLDTEAWKQAEASGRRAHKALKEYLDTLPADA